MILPGVISAALLVFTISLDDYVITSFVAGPGSTTLPLKIYSMVKTGVTPEINAISTVLADRNGLASRRVRASRFGPHKEVVVSRRALRGYCCLWLLPSADKTKKAAGGELNVFIWSNYLPESVIAEFESRYNAKVNVELYDSNEALLARLQSGGVSYDVIVPSDYMVTVLKEQGLLEEIDRDAITNFSNLEPEFVQGAYDPLNQFSIPYMWGTTGIAYRKDKVAGPVDSWSVMWDGRYKDRIAMLDDVRETFGAALKSLGKSLNSTDPAEIRTGRAIARTSRSRW